jgi:pilus assembly protein CpaC
LKKDPALDGVNAVSSSQGVALEGDVRDLASRQRAADIAAEQSGAKVTDNVAVTGRRMVAVEVRFAAISTSTLKALGLNFQKLGQGFEFASSVPGSLNGFSFDRQAGLKLNGGLPIVQAFNLLLAGPNAGTMGALSILGSVNLAHVLAEPTLMVRSGDDAHFLAGGEIPIPVAQSGQNSGTISIQYRKFGVQLGVHATVLSDDRIVLAVSPEVSELDYQNALTLNGFNVPAINVRSTDTTIELGDGQSFVLAGLMYSSAGNVEEKVPGLGDLPIIGDFFKHSQHAGTEQELVIVATPHLVSPLAPGAMPPLPGEGVTYAPSSAEMLLNSKQLDAFTAQYGLAGR